MGVCPCLAHVPGSSVGHDKASSVRPMDAGPSRAPGGHALVADPSAGFKAGTRGAGNHHPDTSLMQLGDRSKDPASIQGGRKDEQRKEE